jgi:hypothetical protein
MQSPQFVVLLLAVLLLSSTTSAAIPNYAMEFHPSSFLVNRADSTAPHGIAVPVSIQLVDSDGKPDTSDSTTVITASVSSGAISGNVAKVTNGVASFTMVFTSCTTGTVTFTAHSAGGAAVAGKTLQSGKVAVTAVPNSELLFDASSTLQAGHPASATAGAKLPAFKINLYDSCGARDASMTGLTISATASSGVLGGETTATFTDGVAIFSDLYFVEAVSGAQLTFTVGASASPVAVSHKKLTTGDVLVQPKLPISTLPLVLGFVASCVGLLLVVIYWYSRRQSAQNIKYVAVATISSTESTV